MWNGFRLSATHLFLNLQLITYGSLCLIMRNIITSYLDVKRLKNIITSHCVLIPVYSSYERGIFTINKYKICGEFLKLFYYIERNKIFLFWSEICIIGPIIAKTSTSLRSFNQFMNSVYLTFWCPLFVGKFITNFIINEFINKLKITKNNFFNKYFCSSVYW
jgi:hypothetical protein